MDSSSEIEVESYEEVIGHLDYQLSSVGSETVPVTSPLSVAAFHGPNSKVSRMEDGAFSSTELSVPVPRPALRTELSDDRKQRAAAVASNDRTDHNRDGRATRLLSVFYSRDSDTLKVITGSNLSLLERERVR